MAIAVRARVRSMLCLAALATAIALGGAFFPTEDGVAGPGSLANRFFGPSMVRAEVVLMVNGVLLDYRLDRGRIRALRNGSLILFERDRTLVTIPLAAGADVQLNNQPVPLSALRRGFKAVTIREGDGPAQAVYAFSRR
jgi:hypothetical protein